MIQNTINKLHRAIFRKIVARYIRQGPNHLDNLAEMQRIIVREWQREFYEDNMPTHYYAIVEGFERGFNEVWYDCPVTTKMRHTWAGFAHTRIP